MNKHVTSQQLQQQAGTISCYGSARPATTSTVQYWARCLSTSLGWQLTCVSINITHISAEHHDNKTVCTKIS